MSGQSVQGAPRWRLAGPWGPTDQQLHDERLHGRWQLGSRRCLDL